MVREYYQMGWTLGEQYEEDYYFSKDDNKYFIKKNTTPIIATLSAEGIVPKLKWTKRLSNGDVIIAQDFENGRTLLSSEMVDERIPKILSKVHNSAKIKKMMKNHGYSEETAENSFRNLELILPQELKNNKDIHFTFEYLKNNIPEEPKTYSPCHADLHKDNWLLSDKGKLFLVDWEQAVLGDAAIDISFILYKYIPRENWSSWLEEYGIELTLKYQQKLKWYMLFQSLIMVVWYHEKRQFSYMNEWLIFINKVFME